MAVRYVTELSDQEFINTVEQSTPVIITEQFKQWPATNNWSFDFFAKEYSNTVVTVDKQSSTIQQFVDSIESGESVYMQQVTIENELLPLLEDLKPLPTYLQNCRARNPLMPKSFYYPNGIFELFMGGPGAGFFKLHYDLFFSHALIVQIKGRKHFRIFKHEDKSYLYTNPDHPHLSEIDNPFDPDLDKYPAFKQATPYDVTVNPGEAVLLPCGWWHTTRFDEPTIAIALNLINQSNWSVFVDDFVRCAKKAGTINGLIQKLRLTGIGIMESLKGN